MNVTNLLGNITYFDLRGKIRYFELGEFGYVTEEFEFIADSLATFPHKRHHKRFGRIKFKDQERVACFYQTSQNCIGHHGDFVNVVAEKNSILLVMPIERDFNNLPEEGRHYVQV